MTTIFEQQVLDNLAMFVYAPDSLPFFAFPNAGGSDVNDKGNVAGAINWARAASGFDSANLGVAAERSLTESWTLTPITDPRKLELMRCAYQRAISPCLGTYESGTCPNCQNAFAKFYTGSVKGDIPKQEVDADGVTSDCIGHRCWFGFGCKRCIPRGCGCIKVGQYCGVYVWVLPSGQDELTKLTLAILDYAMYSAPPQPTKNVTWYFDEKGNPVTEEKAVRVEAATLLLDAPTPKRLPPVPRREPEAIEALPPEERIQAERAAKAAAERAVLPLVPQEPVRSPIPNSDYLQFQQNLRFLTPRR